MRIRTKLVAYFLIIASLVAMLGGAAYSRVRSIDKSVQDLADNAIPRLQLAERLSQTQREQQMAALSYVASGRPEDRQRYLDLSERFDAELAKLKAEDSSDEGKALLAEISAERAKFTQAGSQLLTSRDTVDRSTTSLRSRYEEMVQQLNKIRQRFVPTGGAASDVGAVPVSLRNQVNDLLLGTEGMLHQVAREFQIANAFVLSPDDALKEELNTASTLFSSSLQVAYNAGGSEDRVILQGVQSSMRAFETSARAMINAGDVSRRARGAFPEASDRISGQLAGYVERQSAQMTAAKEDSTSAVSGAEFQITIISLIAFAVAGLAGWIFAGTITKPIIRLRDAADRVSTGDVTDVDIDVDSNDELADLAASFRRMVASIKFLMMRGDGRDDDEEEAGYTLRAAS